MILPTVETSFPTTRNTEHGTSTQPFKLSNSSNIQTLQTSSLQSGTLPQPVNPGTSTYYIHSSNVKKEIGEPFDGVSLGFNKVYLS